METRFEDLRKWFGKGKKGDWVRVGTDGEIKGDCAREPGEGKPKCMPRSKAHSMDKKDRASSARRKRRADPSVDRPGTGNKPIMVKTDKKESVEMNEKTKWKMGDGRPRNGARIQNDRFWNLPRASLEYIRKDAHAAMKANPNGKKAGKYADEVNDAETVLAWRKKNGIRESVKMNEQFVVKYAKNKRGPIYQTKFSTQGEAEKFLAQKRKEGMNGIVSKAGKPVSMQKMADLQKEEVELDEATAKIKTTMADKVASSATRFGLKATTKGGHVSISGSKGKLNDFMRAIIGRSSYGNASDVTESVDLDEAADFMKMSKELLKHKSKGIEYEKAAAYIRVIHNNSAVSVQDKAFMALTKMLKDMDDLVKKTTITKILKDNGFKVKGGKLMRESVDESTMADRRVVKAVRIAKDMGGNMTGAVRRIEKLKKGLSDHPKVQAALRLANESLEEKNVPTNPSLWAKMKAQAKAKFDVYPSAYANGWAAKKYKAAGGSWKTESVQESKSFWDIRDLNENYRTLARHGMGTETKNSINVGREIDYYDGAGTKRMGKVTKMGPKSYMVKDDKDGKVRQFTYHDRAKAKELLAKK